MQYPFKNAIDHDGVITKFDFLTTISDEAVMNKGSCTNTFLLLPAPTNPAIVDTSSPVVNLLWDPGLLPCDEVYDIWLEERSDILNSWEETLDPEVVFTLNVGFLYNLILKSLPLLEGIIPLEFATVAAPLQNI